MHKMILPFAVGVIGIIFTVGCNQGGSNTPLGKDSSNNPSKTGKPKFAFITNCEADFWKIAEKGVNAAAKEFDVEAIYREPRQSDPGLQKEIIEDLLTNGVDGIAITPIDPQGQLDALNKIGEKTLFICHDSDAPESNRKVFIGVDNYTAGRQCGKLIKQAIPNGGSIIIFVGNVEQLNAKQRRQGLIDELFDRTIDPTRFDQLGAPIKEGDKYTVLDTITDSNDRPGALAKAEDSILKYPDLGCMVGLFGYNPPICLRAIKNANKVGKIKVVAFDEDNETLQGIIDGEISGTIVQNPYLYGYESIRVLKELKAGNTSIIPENKYIPVPERTITKENVETFWKELKELTK